MTIKRLREIAAHHQTEADDCEATIQACTRLIPEARKILTAQMAFHLHASADLTVFADSLETTVSLLSSLNK